MIKYRGDIGGVKVTKGMGLMRNIGMKTFGSDFIPPCVIYLADITCVSTSSMLLSSKTRVLAFGR